MKMLSYGTFIIREKKIQQQKQNKTKYSFWIILKDNSSLKANFAKMKDYHLTESCFWKEGKRKKLMVGWEGHKEGESWGKELQSQLQPACVHRCQRGLTPACSCNSCLLCQLQSASKTLWQPPSRSNNLVPCASPCMNEIPYNVPFPHLPLIL